MADNSKIELRSEEVQDILTRVPHWMIRWGTVLLFGIIIMLFFISWFVKYPEVIVTEVIITTKIPPEKLIAKTSGKIEVIKVMDRAFIVKNTPIAVIENSANYEDMFLLKSIVDTIDINKNNFPFELLKSSQLGEVESSFSIFQKEWIAAELNAKLQPYQIEGNAQNYETLQLKERLRLLQSQKTNNQDELLLQKKDLERYEGLFDKGIISDQEFEKHKLSYLLVDRNYKNLLSTISQLKSSINELNKNAKTTIINENKENINLERNVIQSFYQLKKALKDWDLNYVLRSSINGKVTFLQIWTENQNVTVGDNVFAIIPTNEKGYIGKLKAPALNSGKIKLGQKVNIRLANFPDSQYGVLQGKIMSISLTPDKEGNFLIDLELPEKLETSYHKIIPFQQEMVGSAEIVTDDMRLIERFFYQFRAIFNK